MMYTMGEYLAEYQSCHQNKANQWLHLIGVPAIVISSMIFFHWIRVDFFAYLTLPVSWLVILAVLIYYLCLDIKVTVAMTLIYVVMNLIVGLIVGDAPSRASFSFFLVFFVGGWCLLLFGHLIEKKRPALTKNLVHLLIGPVYIVNEFVARLGLTLCKIDDERE